MTPEVDLHDVTVHRGGRVVLDKVSLRLMPGERLGLTGPIGAGKTTLLRTIVGLERARSGTVHLVGKPCQSEADFRAARPAIGFLFQDPDDQLFSPTVIEDVAFGPLNLGLTRTAAFQRAREELVRMGLADLSERPVHHLSGGQKRLVCLAGLFAMDPRVLLLDEPWNGLDPEALMRVAAHLDGFAGAMIIATHDVELIDRLGAARLTMTAGQIGAAD